MKYVPDIATHDGRRAWAFLAILGGSMVFTIFAAIGVYIVRNNAGLSFWLAIAAHAQVFLGMTAIGWAMGRRIESSVGRSGLSLNDKIDRAVDDVADAAVSKADEIKEGV